MATDWSNFAPVDTAPADSSVKWDNFEPANAEEKARLGEEMKSLRRDRKFGNAEEAAIKGAEYFTQGVSKMFPTSAIGGVMDALGVQPPIPAEHVRQAREFLSGLPARAEIPAGVPTVGPAFDPGIEQGVNQFVDELISGLTRPDQAMAIAASGKFPTEVARTFQLAPVVEAPQQIQQIQQASEAGDLPGTVKGIAGLTAGALLPSVIEAGINKPTAIKKATPNALIDSSPAALHGDVRSFNEPAEVVPAAEGGGRILNETSGGIPATPEPAQPARPREENQVPLNRDPNDPAWRAKVDAERYKIVSRAKELSNRSGNEFDANDPVYDELAQAIAAGHADEFIEQQAFGHLDLSGNIGDEQSVAGPAGPGHEALAASRETANDLRKLAGLKPIPPLTSETFGPKSGEAKAPVAKSLKVGEAPTPADIHAATHEEFMAYHDAMKAPGEQRAAVNEFAKSLDENGIKEAERLAQVSRDKAKEIIGGNGPLETRFKQSMEENQRTQFLAEGARTAKAMKAVEEGSTPAEAAKNLGVPVSALEKAPEPVKPVEVAKPTEQSTISERLRKQRARETEDRRGGLFQKLIKQSDEELRASAKDVSAEDKQWIKDRLDAAPGDAPRIRQALGIAPKEEPLPLSKPVKANGKKAPASKQVTVPGSPADEYGAINGPKLSADQVARFKGQEGQEFQLDSPSGTTTTLKVKPSMLWVETSQKAPGSIYEDVGIAYLKIRHDGTTVLDASHHGRPIDKLAVDSLSNFLRDTQGIKEKSAKIPEAKQLPSKQAELTFEEQKAQAEEKPRSYTSATEDESGRLYLNPIGPLIRTTLSDIRDFSHGVKKSAEWIIEKGREAAGLTKEAAKEGFNVGGKINDYRRSVLNWSMKLQKSFGEAAHAQRDIQKRVPDSLRREAITNWIQADGDNTILANRAATTTDKRLKKGYEIAQKLTPDELAIAKQIKGVYDALGQRGQAYGVINNFKENYVTQIWNLKNRLGGSARTLKDKFKYAKARTFDSFYDGEQAGYDPKTKDISKLLPSYLHEMNSVIAARQLVKQMQNGVAADGRPLLVPRGTGTPVSGPSGDATLITPKAVKGDTSDYKLLPNQPALNNWVWAAKDQAGNNIFLKADLMVHPKVYDKLKNTLGRSAIQEWYKSDTGALAMVPKRAVELIDRANAETKRTMLGLITPFHQVQEGTHAVGHRVNPFSVPEIDLVGKPEQADAAKHGLMLLPDRASESQFMDGFQTTGLLSHVPGLGRATDAYSRYLFHDYIPGLKMKTYEAILERNKSVFAKDLATGAVSLEDVKVTSAEQTNAAYGHLNYADLGRNPTISHIARALLLAPDFFEARARFAGQAAKGAIGTKVGREQILALGFLALAQATGAYTFAKLSGGEWDKKHPFEFTHHGKRYTMRSVPEDISSLIKDPRMYFNNRMSPAASTADQLRTGLDWKGDRISAGDTLKEAAQKPIPLSVRAMLKMGSKNLTALEQLAGSIGLKISSANPKMEKGIEIKDRTELLANKLRKLNRVERYKTAKDELKDLPPKDRNTVIDKLRRQGVFTYQ